MSDRLSEAEALLHEALVDIIPFIVAVSDEDEEKVFDWTDRVRSFVRGARENPSRKPSKVQSVLIPTDRYTLRAARKWIKEHGFVDEGVDETERYYRFRQFEPTRHYAYRTISFGDSGIKAVIRVSKRPR